METVDKVLIAILVFLVSACTGIICYDSAMRNVREQAVLKGYGEWKVNSKGTEVTFQWK